MKIASFFLTLSLLALGLHSEKAFAVTPLKFCFEDAPQTPWTMPDGSGLNLELLKRVERRLGENFELVAKPWKRCLEEVRTGVQDGLIGSAVAPERQQFSVFPTMPDGSADRTAALNEDQAKVYIRKDSKANWDGENLINVQQAILVQRAYLVGTILQKKGFQIKEIRSIHEALELLVKGAADIAILQGTETENVVKYDSSINSKIRSAEAAFISLPMYLPVNRETYTQNPRRIEAIWNAIREIRTSSEYRQLLNAAGVP
ncbi:transporter substrate-binding domain-containing protein [Undibacterium sp. Di24W]|uniref:transporter substrate-binding domain-containing protein n=1 Tax=Undibacterium sp. Di24W TaxID=3413033 RepID=UPI003BF30ABB